MLILAVAIILALALFVSGKRAGAAVLAIVAGALVDQLINTSATNFIANIITVAPIDIISAIISLLFIAVTPMILYFRSDKLPTRTAKIIQSITFTAALITLTSGALRLIFIFDPLSSSILSFTSDISHLIILASLAVAYWDILFLRHHN